jgi:N-acetylmuramoyl-L-alanine amidase
MLYARPRCETVKEEFRKIFLELSDAELLARLIFGEARGESDIGKLAVAHVVFNRVKDGRRYGKNLREVIFRPWQFSCFNDNDPNLPKLAAEKISTYPIDKCRTIAGLALQNMTLDPTRCALLYHEESICPTWQKKAFLLCQIDHHLFYKE